MGGVSEFGTTVHLRGVLFARIHALAHEVELHNRPGFLEVGHDDYGVFVQVLCSRKDTNTGEEVLGRGGKRYLRADQTDSQIVRQIFGAFLAYEEHEIREAFLYRGKRIFGPHLDVEALVEVADRVDP